MKDILKKIREALKKGGVNESKINLTKETMISREYFNNEVLSRYPNLEFIEVKRLGSLERNK